MAKTRNKIDKEQIVEYIYILDEETKFLFPSKDGHEMVLSESELNKITNHKAGLKAIIILAELEWQGKYLQHFYGFDLAVELRRKHKLLCPIIITSTLSQSYFSGLAQNKIDIKYKLLFGRGTGFLPFCELNTTLEKTVESLYKFPLTNAVLTDMNEMLLNQKGLVIDKLTHDLKFGIESTKLNEILTDVSNYLYTNQKIELEWETSIKNLNDNVRDIAKFNKTADDLIRNCERILINDSKPADNISERKHKMLVLEDDPDFQKVIKENLKSHFEELLITGSAEKAIELLQDDGRNEITGIISDWRLYADPKEKSYWQIQGYEVLDYAAKNRLIALFALTSLSDRNVHNIRNTLGLDIHLFKKQHLETTDSKVQWEMMADTVKQKCDAILEVISSQPTGETWKNLKNEYIIRRGAGWSSFENEINQDATRIFNYYINAINTDETRNVYSIKELGVVLKNNLKSILIARRVYFGIYFTLVKTNNYLQEVNGKFLGDGNNIDTELKHHSIDTHSLIRKEWWDDISEGLDSTKIEDASSKFDQRMKNLRGTLCIELTELPAKGILPEEKFWFSKNNIDFSFLFNYWQIDQ